MSSVLDNMYVAFMFIAFGFAFLASLVIFNSLVAEGVVSASEAVSFGQFYTSLGNVSIFIAIAMILGSVASAYMIKTNPIFAFVLLLLILVQALVLPPIVEGFNAFAQADEIAPSAAGMSDTIFLIESAPILSIIGSVLAILAGLVIR